MKGCIFAMRQHFPHQVGDRWVGNNDKVTSETPWEASFLLGSECHNIYIQHPFPIDVFKVPINIQADILGELHVLGTKPVCSYNLFIYFLTLLRSASHAFDHVYG